LTGWINYCFFCAFWLYYEIFRKVLVNWMSSERFHSCGEHCLVSHHSLSSYDKICCSSPSCWAHLGCNYLPSSCNLLAQTIFSGSFAAIFTSIFSYCISGFPAGPSVLITPARFAYQSKGFSLPNISNYTSAFTNSTYFVFSWILT